MNNKRIRLLTYKKFSYSSEEIQLLLENRKIHLELNQVVTSLESLREEERKLLNDNMEFLRSSMNDFYFSMLMKNNIVIKSFLDRKNRLDKEIEHNKNKRSQVKSKIKSVEKNIDLLQERVRSNRMEQDRDISLSEILEHVYHDKV
ncbi:TPA: hypothetical protein RQK93_000697 [Vibrio vulnificus]|nr:hypothetical protein [Vibrio vulnificus]